MLRRTSVDVDPHRLTGEGKLVHCRDQEVAEDVLGGFRHLSRGCSHGMTVPATRTGEESSTARAVLTSSVPPTAVVLPDIPEQPADHHPPGGVREGEVLSGISKTHLFRIPVEIQPF